MSEIAQAEQKSARSPVFKRIDLPTGQLGIKLEVEDALSSKFTEDLIKEAPWFHPEKGKCLASSYGRRRRVEMHKIGRTEIVLKETEQSGEEIRGKGLKYERSSVVRKHVIQQNSIIAQARLIEEAKSRYQKAYGEPLPLEELMGYFIDRKTTKRYFIYKYYDPLPLPVHLGNREFVELTEKIGRIDDKLEAIGVNIGEAGVNFVVTTDPLSTKERKLVLVDTELWHIDKM